MATQARQSLGSGKTRVRFVPGIQCQPCTARCDCNRKHSFRFLGGRSEICPVKKEGAKIVFVLRDGKYYLAEFWCMSDRRVVTAEFDHRGQTTAGQRDVQLSYP
jgi:hypothetical protein